MTMNSPLWSPEFNEDTSSSFGDYNTSSSVEENQSEDSFGYKYDYEVLNEGQISTKLHECVSHLAGILNVTETEARFLLNTNRCNSDDIINAFLSLANGDEFRRKFGLVVATEHSPIILNECDICSRDATDCVQTKLVGTKNCEHRFCLDCWNDYLVARIVNDTNGAVVPCAAYKCDSIVEDAMALLWLRDTKIKSIFEAGMGNIFVQCNPKMRWCPGPDCTYAISVNCVQPRPVRCVCNHEFCFGCGNGPHEPIECAMLERWNPELMGQTSTKEWLMKYTKKCHTCGIHIQKSGGCNYMHCSSCKTSFCWLCGGEWANATNHYKHACNEYEANKATGQNSAPTNVSRRDHYVERYLNHLMSVKFEHDLNEKIIAKIVDLAKYENIAQTNTQFIRRAFQGLIECRRVLSMTYVFAYFTMECNQLHIFLANQRDLETATEQLSFLLENETISNETLPQFQEAVETKLGYCIRRRTALCTHIREGAMLGWWIDVDTPGIHKE